MSCSPVCIRETTPRDDASPGVVLSSELIYRAFYPSDRNVAGIRRAAITAKHLWAGELSVWRMGPHVPLNMSELIDFLNPILIRQNSERFDQLRGASTLTIRAYEFAGERGFSVLDECVVDDDGNKHPAHAHIAICERLKATIADRDENFVALQEWLKLLFERQPVAWQRPS